MGGAWARTNLPTAVSSTNYSAANQQLTFGSKTLAYDFNGNLSSMTDPGGTTTFTWDSRDRLTSMSGPSVTATFGYDGLGRRRTKTINGTRTDFLYDALNPVQEGILPGSPAANLLTGLELDAYFTRSDAAGARTFLTEALGSTVALADPAGAVQTQYTYEPLS